MPREKIDAFMDLSNVENKRKLITSIGAMHGVYEVEISPRRLTRSLAQNRWYWSCICKAFADYLRSQDYEITTDDEAHEFLKARFLAVTVHHKTTGEILGRRVRSTTELTTEEFSQYCERCRAWLLDFFGIVVPDPGEYAEPAKAGAA